MLVTQALDERDLLVKKITDRIAKARKKEKMQMTSIELKLCDVRGHLFKHTTQRGINSAENQLLLRRWISRRRNKLLKFSKIK